LWQRNYYEHVVRGEDDMRRIRQYIPDKPHRWPLEAENRSNVRQARYAWSTMGQQMRKQEACGK